MLSVLQVSVQSFDHTVELYQTPVSKQLKGLKVYT